MSPTLLYSLAGISVVILLFLWSRYNAFVTTRNQVKTDFADIDVQLKRRASLIENLAEIVKGYAKHEKETFQNVAKARSAVQSAQGPKDSANVNNMLTSTLKSLIAVAEDYPKLRASDNFQQLTKQLEETENNIAQYRETYNQSVLHFNTMLQTFPNLLAAAVFGFKEEELFAVNAQESADVSVKI